MCGAVRHFARTLASEIGEDGVTVNAISVPVGRPEDAAAAVRLLCSPDGGYLTSESLTLRRGGRVTGPRRSPSRARGSPVSAACPAASRW